MVCAIVWVGRSKEVSFALVLLVLLMKNPAARMIIKNIPATGKNTRLILPGRRSVADKGGWIVSRMPIKTGQWLCLSVKQT